MSSPLERRLAERMAGWDERGLRRRLEPPDTDLVDFCTNDYLGLSRDPELIAAACAATRQHGAGGRASRLLAGGSEEHHRLEREAAEWLGVEATLLFPSGYQANLGLITALTGLGDVILSDRLDHASIIDACRLSRARVQVFRHDDAGHLEALLEREAAGGRCLVVTEGVFSMDGDLASLPTIEALCARYGADLVVDEAHAVGLLGPAGTGAWADTVDAPTGALAARVVTGGKALGVAGALVAGSRRLIDHLVNHARPFVFTTAPPPSVPAALRAAIGRVAGDAELRERPRRLARRLAERLGLEAPAAAIVAVVLGDEQRALDAAARCRDRGLGVRAVRPPSVPPGTSRLRVCCHAHNDEDEVDTLAGVLEPFLERGSRTTVAGAGPGPDDEQPPLPVAAVERAPTWVVGTDTGVGKTVVSAALLAACRDRGSAAYWKPVQTGTESDTATVARLSGAAAEELHEPCYELALPASPHEAADAAGLTIDPARISDGLRQHLQSGPEDGTLIVELAGGLLVPYTLETTQADLLVEIPGRIVLVARSGLGTLNHTLLTVEALARRDLDPDTLVLVGAPHRSNRATLQSAVPGCRLLELPPLDPLDAGTLAAWAEEHGDALASPPDSRSTASVGDGRGRDAGRSAGSGEATSETTGRTPTGKDDTTGDTTPDATEDPVEDEP